MRRINKKAITDFIKRIFVRDKCMNCKIRYNGIMEWWNGGLLEGLDEWNDSVIE